MNISNKIKKYFIFLFITGFILFGFRVLAFFSEPTRDIDFKNSTKSITLNDNGLIFRLSTSAETINGLFEENNLSLNEHDKVIPEKDAKIFSGSQIEIQRATKIKLAVDGKTIDNYVLGKTVGEALSESQVTLSHLDKTMPASNNLVQNNLLITVTRINIEEVTEKEDVPFKTIVQNDVTLGWQEKKIATPGQFGTKEVRYRITYKNGQETSRVILNSEIDKAPVAQTEIHGTYMKLGKAAAGQGTWYAYRGGMFAASTTLPKGSYAKVTNTANGKSIVVQINDYGPQGKGRIIDLDKVAFAKIASIGAGVIGVKVEPILN